ncbi:Purine catabolism protein pucB [Candidatus Terasakiella magnetica]|nr:Purine catabolism protein pucB [Candidatus Terasakiella magnetica]
MKMISFGIAAIILAAGRASRMGRDKRILPVNGVPMVLRAVAAAHDAGLAPVVVVTGPEGLDLLPEAVVEIRNPAPERGMASSLALGVDALPCEAAAAVVLLADMPKVTAAHVVALAAAFAPENGHDICVPVFQGRRGNPVLLGRRFFAGMRGLEGDKGARGLIQAHAEAVLEVVMADDGVLIDVDTPEALAALEAMP